MPISVHDNGKIYKNNICVWHTILLNLLFIVTIVWREKIEFKVELVGCQLEENFKSVWNNTDDTEAKSSENKVNWIFLRL